jgi:phosphotransferase system enzyme I (PtsI)
LARSLQIPAVTGLVDASQQLVTGQPVLLDGYSGILVLHPTEQTLYEYGQVERKQLALRDLLVEVHDQPATTLDGKRIILSANAENLEEVPAILANGAEGIGLFRTEYLFLKRDSLPTEEEQYQAYSQMANALKPQPVIIRTLDLGGDKAIACLGIESERNPFLGWRAIRICLQETDLFCGQLRAILRASVSGNIRMMYPMISGVDELLQANALLDQCKQELRLQGVPFDENLEVGVMIEVPAAAMMADHLAKRVSFFSVGTNDLVQYSLAVDRMNPKIAHLYEPTHPSILRLIKHTVDAAHANGIWVGVCGEMASDPVLIPILIGLGVDELSTAVPLVPAAKYIIRRLDSVAAKQLADFAVNCESGAEVLARADAFARSVAPALFADMQRPT